MAGSHVQGWPSNVPVYVCSAYGLRLAILAGAASPRVLESRVRQQLTLSSFCRGRPAPDIQDKVALMPFCDNGNIISSDPNQVIIVRDTIIKKLGETVFGVHEITDAETKFDTLGVSVDGVRRVVCSTPKRVSKVLAVLEFL